MPGSDGAVPVNRSDQGSDHSGTPIGAMKVFVIWDFTIAGASAILDRLRSEVTSSHGRPIEWTIPGLDRQQGEIARDVVETRIRESDGVLAILDAANINVAWELGLALGLGKRVWMASIGPIPEWLQFTILSNYVVEPSLNPDRALRLIDGAGVTIPRDPTPTGRDDGALLLVADDAEDQALTEGVPDAIPGLRVERAVGWSLRDLGVRLRGIGCVIWLVSPSRGSVWGRDGAANASNAVVASIASAWGRSVSVLRPAGYRPLRDVEPIEYAFSGRRAFLAALSSALDIARPDVGLSLPEELGLSRELLRYLVGTEAGARTTLTIRGDDRSTIQVTVQANGNLRLRQRLQNLLELIKARLTRRRSLLRMAETPAAEKQDYRDMATQVEVAIERDAAELRELLAMFLVEPPPRRAP